MPTPIPSHFGIRQTSEAVWLAWIQSKALPGTPLAPCSFFTGQSTAEIVLPAVVVAVNNAREMLTPNSGYYEADVDILVMMSPDVGPDADVTQALMVGQVESLLYGPDPGETSSVRAVADDVQKHEVAGRGLSIHGFWIEDQTGQAMEQHWIDTIRLKVHCSPNSNLS